MRLERHHSASVLNQVLNHPEVRPWIANGDDYADASQQVANPNNVLLMGEHGGCMFLKLMPGVYEVHTQVLPEGHGQWTNQMTQAAVDWMFLRTDCYEIMTRVPKGHVAAKAAALNRRFRYEFTRHNECRFREQIVDVDIYALRIVDWVSSADWLAEIGHGFHKEMDAEAKRLGIVTPQHADDDNHNLYVGAAITMLRQGQIAKGIQFYNRWALVSRHETVTLIAVQPLPVIKIDHGIYVTFYSDRIGLSLS